MNAASPLPPGRHDRGIALISALLMLMLISVLAVSYMAVTVTERSVSSNVHVAKGSLYAADAGIRTAQQQLANMGRAKIDSLIPAYTGAGALVPSPHTLFPAGGIPVSATSPRFDAVATVRFQDSVFSVTSQTYDFRYTITSTGEVGLQGTRRVLASGVLRLSAARGSFADYLMFTNVHTTPSGAGIWFSSTGNFDGRVHTNGEFRFAYQPTFHDLVTSAGNQAYFYNNGSPLHLAANSNGSVDAPSFFGGFTRGAQVQSLPTNAYNQQNAALGESPTTSPPSNTTINAKLGTGAGGATPPNGIYVPQSSGTVVGGIYVQGSLDNCNLSIDGGGRQVYTLQQGATTKTITVDRAANQTIVQEGASTTTLTGIPLGCFYVNGSINAMRGPARVSGVPQPAIAAGTLMLITATNDIVLQNDVTCDNYTAGNNVLGLFSSGGNVRVGSSAPNDMNLDAFVMATGATGIFAVDNYNSGGARGVFHLRGGMVSSYYGGFGTFSSGGGLNTGYGRDFHYDRRGLIPPYFPGNSNYVQNAPTARSTEWREV